MPVFIRQRCVLGCVLFAPSSMKTVTLMKSRRIFAAHLRQKDYQKLIRQLKTECNFQQNICINLAAVGSQNTVMTSVTFSSENAKGACPGVMEGDISNTKKGLVVLQEWWGMNEQIKQEAKNIGKMGNFMTLVPDLYRGKVADDREEAGHLLAGLDWPGAVADIKGAAEFLLSKGCTKVGVTGFCMGGALTLASAALVSSKTISAVAPFYGIPSDQLCDVSKINVPVQAHFGEKDSLEGFSSPKDAQALKEKLSHNPDFELYMYPDCDHAFTNYNGPNYKKEMCDLALNRMVAFMNKHL